MATSTALTSLTEYGDKATAPTRKSRTISDAEGRKVSELIREFSQFQVFRSTFAGQWEEAAELIDPVSRNTFYYQNYNFPGAKKTQQQVDATGMRALHRFCAIADSLVTPRNMHWHGLQGDEYVMKDRASKLWFDATAKLLFQERYKDHANFVGQNYSNWRSLGAYGNSTMFVDQFDARWGGGRGLRYKSVPLGETFYGQNHQGKVDRIYRWFKLTAYQAVQKWGEDALPENLVAPLQQDSQWPYNFLHVVKPRDDDYDPEALDVKALPFVSYYVSLEGRCLMQREGGYRVFPYAVSRYDQGPDEVYGRGPAQIVLPSLKTINAQKVTFLKQGHRAADPVLLIADDGVVGMDLRPGAMNKGGVNSDGRPLVHTLPTGSIQTNIEMMQQEAEIIDDVFLVSIMKALVDNPNMTATQVIQLVNERGMLVAPTLGRQHSERVAMQVERELDLLSAMRMLEPMPPRLQEAMGEYQVTDTSPLARAARMGEAIGFNSWVENLTKLATETQDPSWLDPVNGDVSAVELADIYSVPVRWTADANQIAAKRKARSNAAAQQARIAALPAEAQMISAQAKVAESGLGQQGALPA